MGIKDRVGAEVEFWMREAVIRSVKAEVLQRVSLEPFDWLVMTDRGDVMGISEDSIIEAWPSRPERIEHDGSRPRVRLTCECGNEWMQPLPHAVLPEGVMWNPACPTCGRVAYTKTGDVER